MQLTLGTPSVRYPAFWDLMLESNLRGCQKGLGKPWHSLSSLEPFFGGKVETIAQRDRRGPFSMLDIAAKQYLSSNPNGDIMNHSNPFKVDWPLFWKGVIPNPLDLVAAPQNLIQPILPGWVVGGVINVNETNSKSPDTEREIVSRISYGKQINCMMDILNAIIKEVPRVQQDPAFKNFEALSLEITQIKLGATARRLDRIASDLATLKERKPDEYEQIVARLRDALKEA
jgi:hypothetical protein